MIRPLAFILYFGFTATCLAAPPTPVLAWPNGPLETRVAFDRPADESMAKAMIGKTITFGGKDGDTSSQGTMRIAGARLADGGRTLILATDPHSRDATYHLTVGSTALEYTLHGAAVTWTGDDQSSWSGWWPGLDADALRKLAKSSAEHARMLSFLSKPGRVQLLGVLNLPEGNYPLKIKASGIVDATIGDAGGMSGDDGSIDLALESTGEPIDLDLTVHTNEGKPFALSVASQKENDAAATPISTRLLLLPWTPIAPFVPASTSPMPDLTGGDPAKGEQVYNGDTAKCASCHKINGKGGEVGPDLTKQAERDLNAIYRDINEPSAVIHPDFVFYTVATKNGQIASGIVRAEGPDAIKVTDANAKTTIIPRSEIDDLRPGSASLMPVGLVGAIGEAKMKDLLAYLKSGGKAKATTDDADNADKK
jgi:putative heme-binding domain-containing protein